MKKILLPALIAGLFATPALAFAPFTVKDIRVEGIQRTEAGTVFNYLPVKVGDTLDDEKAAQAIKALFATGFFKDVRVEVENDVMVVVLAERPAIAKIQFVGMKEFEKDAIVKALKETGVAEGRIFDRALLDRAEQELKRQYLSRGKYAANITTTVTPLERNRVGINFNIEEGAAARIKEINIVGAKMFDEKTLRKLFELTTPGWTTWYTKNDQYSRQKLAADIEKLKSFYLNQGYLEFAVDSTQVSISPDKRDVFITLSVNEGDRYQVSSVKLAGNLVIDEEEARKLVTVRAGDVFSRERLNDSTKAISDRLGKEGYAFANVNAAPEIDKDKRQVAFTIFVDPGKRVYVRRINVSGNTRTRDEVIRRELRQMESAWYDAAKLENSKQRLDRLGFFQDINVETPAVPGTADQVDVDLKITEKPTGSLMLGAGISSTEKLVLSGSVTQTNFMGSGNSVGIQVNSGKINRTYSFSYTNPYFTPDGVSQGFDVYHRNVDATALTTVGAYKSASTGGGVRFGFPINEKESIGVGLAIDTTAITTYSNSPARYIDFVNRFGGSNISIPASVNWTFDSKDSYFAPTRGLFSRAGLEVALPGGDLTYWRATYAVQHFTPLTKSLTLQLGGDIGLANGYSGKGLPFYKNYFAGGIGTVRGYKTSSLGPVVINSDGTDARIGGSRRLVLNSELQWALPGMEKTVRMGWFIDGGMIKASADDLAGMTLGTYTEGMRYSTGLTTMWISPVGPLKFSLGRPIAKKPGDQTEFFQFQMGTTF